MQRYDSNLCEMYQLSSKTGGLVQEISLMQEGLCLVLSEPYTSP